MKPLNRKKASSAGWDARSLVSLVARKNRKSRIASRARASAKIVATRAVRTVANPG